MSDEFKSNEPEITDDFESCTIEELLQTIDELENRNFNKVNINQENSSYLIDEDFNEVVGDEQVNHSDPLLKSKCSLEISSLKSINKQKGETTASIVFSWAKVVVIALVIALLVNKFVIANALIPSGSMESTIMTGDRVIGFKTSYIFTSPKRGDIVIFKNPDDESKLYIKRIIGVPGDKVEIIDGLVYINDSEEPLIENYLSVTPKGDYGPYEVPEDSYFMLGDNRNVSKDSRFWENTFVHEDKIIAKACFRYYPSLDIIK